MDEQEECLNFKLCRSSSTSSDPPFPFKSDLKRRRRRLLRIPAAIAAAFMLGERRKTRI